MYVKIKKHDVRENKKAPTNLFVMKPLESYKRMMRANC